MNARVGPGFNAMTVAAPTVTVTGGGGGGHSAWHSPLPYLFGGMAAMLGLIAVALLILACSYWKHSGSHLGTDSSSGGGGGGAELYVVPPVSPVPYKEQIVVIMAGDEKPTFFATPMSTRASSFGDQSLKNDGKEEEEEEEEKVERCKGSSGNETQTKDQNQNMEV